MLTWPDINRAAMPEYHYIDKMFALFQEMLLKPVFPEKEIRRKIAGIRADIRSSRDEPGVAAMDAFRKTLYKEGPYGHPVEGREAALENMSRKDVVDFYRRFYHPNRGILAVVGDIDPQEVSSIVEKPLQSWIRTESPPSTFTSEFAVGPKVVETNRPVDQANTVLGHRGISRANKDFYALAVMNHILGAGGFGSRLMQEIRVERGLVYSVQSEFNALKHTGSFQISLQTQNATAAEAVRAALGQMKMIRREGVTEKELSTATNT